MKTNQLVMWIALVVAIGIPIYISRRSKNVFSSLNEFVAAEHLVARSASPVAVFGGKDPPEGLHFHGAYDGKLGSAPLTLLLLRRTESVLVKGVPMQNMTFYVGAYLPQAADESLLKTWQERATKRQGGVVYAARAAEGGVVVVWQGPPSGQNVRARLGELRSTLKDG